LSKKGIYQGGNLKNSLKHLSIMIQEKIVICEDHPIYSKGIEDYLQNYYEVAGNFKTGMEAVHFIEKNKVDLLLLDLNLPDINGIEVIELLHAKKIAIKIVVISMYNDKMLIEKCKKLQVHAYCSKHVTNAALLDILKNTKEGVFLVDSTLKGKMATSKPPISSENFESKIRLTAREAELVALFSKGFSNKDIASQLCVSIFTIDTHKKNIYKKLDIKSVVELVNFYHENF